jgi:hypothetical protein
LFDKILISVNLTRQKRSSDTLNSDPESNVFEVWAEKKPKMADYACFLAGILISWYMIVNGEGAG